MRKLIFLLTSGVAILFIMGLFFFFQLSTSPKKESAPNLSLPTPVPLIPQEGKKTQAPNVQYNENKTNELINKVKTRQPLSPEGASAKQKLISSLGNTSGNIFTNNNVQIDYVGSPDLFQAEILTTNITLAKQEAVNFMLAQGFLQTDICSLPLSFYLNSQVSSQLKNSNTIFNPLPEGC